MSDTGHFCPDGHNGFQEISPNIYICLTNDEPPRVRSVWQFSTYSDPVFIKKDDHWLVLQLATTLWQQTQTFAKAMYHRGSHAP